MEIRRKKFPPTEPGSNSTGVVAISVRKFSGLNLRNMEGQVWWQQHYKQICPLLI